MIFILFILGFIFSGCAPITSQSSPDILDKELASSSSEEKETQIEDLEKKLQLLRQENAALKEENRLLRERLKKQKVIIRTPTAKEIQTALKRAGFYKGKIDGKIGPATKQAIISFQKKHNLVVDGVVGSKTWEKLRRYLE